VERNPRRASDIEVQADDEVLVEGHATLIQSAIRNLLSNAFKFTREGQRIRAVVSSRDGQGVIVVEDGGPGIPAGDRDRIFDPFFRGPDARAEHEGFGLGLPILRRVARAHGGDVVVLASDLGGARFEFSLPRWTEQG
jgi:signal transduction histidine kinase